MPGLRVALHLALSSVAIVFALPALSPTSEWQDLGALSPSETVKLTLGLVQQNRERLEQQFWEVSDPDSPNYGHFLSLDEIATIVALPEESIQKVMAWAHRVGTDVRGHATQDYVFVTVNATVAREELRASLRRYRHTSGSGGEQLRALGGYTLPMEIRKYVEKIFPLDSLPHPRRRNTNKRRHNSPMPGGRNNGRKSPSWPPLMQPTVPWPQDCGTWKWDPEFNFTHAVTPEVVYLTYNISTATAHGASRGSMAVVGSPEVHPMDDQFNPEDIALFSSRCGLPQLKFTDRGNRNIPNRSMCGIQEDPTPPGDCSEGTMDVINEHMVAPNVPIQFWTVTYNDFLGWMVQLNDAPDAALVHSTSSSVPESHYADRERTDVEMMKAGLRGLTLTFSSGDDGVWPECGVKADRFQANYPPTSPYAIGVGATEFRTCGVPGDEIGCRNVSPCYDGPGTHDESGYSGGGFSDIYPVPTYQKHAVDTWMAESKRAGTQPPRRFWNMSGAGFPDVAALGVSELILGKNWSFGGGTSASSPYFAGLVALLNDARLSKGMKPMGFINPWLYKVARERPDAFNDITYGNNKCENKFGFESARGWDPVTGLGTLNVGVLLEIAVAQRQLEKSARKIIV